MLPRYFVPFFVVVILGAIMITGNLKLRYDYHIFPLCIVLALYAVYTTYIIGQTSGIMLMMRYLPGVFLLALPKDKQSSLLEFVTKWISIIMGVSLIGWIIHLFIPMPFVPFRPDEISESYSGFFNYYLFLEAPMYETIFSNLYRFSGPFLEPGHQSLLCAFLLFANRFRMRKYPLMWILVISVIMSFSLAGYIILVVALSLVAIRNVYRMLATVILVTGLWITVTEIWNGGQNPVNTLIIARLEFDKEKGIVGNNRTSKMTDYFFKESVKDGTWVMGVQNSKRSLEKIEGAGYKVFILRYGAVACIFTLLIYLLYIPPRPDWRYSLSFLFLMILVFLQRAYPDWYSWILPYVLGNGIMQRPGLPDSGDLESPPEAAIADQG